MSLAGVRLLSLAQNVPGPVAVARLVREGARAIKIEPTTGDPLASMCPSWYEELHQGVHVERLDLKTSDGYARLMALAADVDLLLTSQRPSALARLALDPDSVISRCPHLRVLRLVGSRTDPETPGHDLTYQASAGLLRHALPTTLVADVMAGERLVSTGLLLLQQPPGSVVDVGLCESLEALAAPLRHGLTSAGGILGGGRPEYGVYAAKEGRVAVAALEPHFRARLYASLGLSLGADLRAAFLSRTAVEWQQWARAHDLPIVALTVLEGPSNPSVHLS